MYNKKIKCMLFILTITCLIFYTINGTSIQSYAKTKDITYSISSQDKNNVKKLTKCFSTPCGYDLTEQMIQGEERGYKFSNASARQHILNLAYEEIYDQKIDEYELSKRLFGVKTSNVNPLIGNW